MRVLLVVPFTLLLSACVVGTVASTAVDVITLPVKAASAGIDAVTTSQSEADENRGRALRKAEEDYGRRYRAWQSDCARLQKRGQPCPPEPQYVAPR